MKLPKRVFIVHGWSGNPRIGWFKWLQKELEKKGYSVTAPLMPDADEPVIGKWVHFLSKLIRAPDEQTYLVGHSIGCQAILRYLQPFPRGEKVGGVILVGGWPIKLTGLGPEEDLIAKPWMETPILWERIKSTSPNFVAIHSDNDPYVPLENADCLKKNLGAHVHIEHNKGHYTESDTNTIPIVLNELLRISRD